MGGTRAVITLAACALTAALAAGCGAERPAGPVTTATCPWSEPSPDPAQPTSTCGVAGTDLSVTIPRHADLLPMTIELSESRALTCAPASDCAIGDGRPAPAVGPGPAVDGSRRRALITMDWADDRAGLHLGPRCRLVGAAMQQCTAIPAAATRWALTAEPTTTRAWRLHLTLDVPGDPGGAPVAAVSDRWDLTLDPTDARLVLDGVGHGTPDFALATVGDVRCTDPGAPPPRPPAPEPDQHYACTVVLPANP